MIRNIDRFKAESLFVCPLLITNCPQEPQISRFTEPLSRNVRSLMIKRFDIDREKGRRLTVSLAPLPQVTSRADRCPRTPQFKVLMPHLCSIKKRFDFHAIAQQRKVGIQMREFPQCKKHIFTHHILMWRMRRDCDDAVNG